MGKTKRKPIWQERLRQQAIAAAVGRTRSRLVIELDREGARDLLVALATSIERVSHALGECETLAEEESATRQLALLCNIFESVDAMVADNGWRGGEGEDDSASEEF